jgi:hypothetical protein
MSPDAKRLHLGLTEAGMGSKGITASVAALGILLQRGIRRFQEFGARLYRAALRRLRGRPDRGGISPAVMPGLVPGIHEDPIH